MVILALDPGARTGFARLDGDHLTDLRALPAADVPALLRSLPRPDLVVIETPSHAGSSWSMDSYGTLREQAGRLVGLVEALWPGVAILRPWPQPRGKGEAWQPWAHDAARGKDASLARVLRHLAPGVVVPRSADAWDAGAMACWARWGRT
jgi:hypothetical protein